MNDISRTGIITWQEECMDQPGTFFYNISLEASGDLPQQDIIYYGELEYVQ